MSTTTTTTQKKKEELVKKEIAIKILWETKLYLNKIQEEIKKIYNVELESENETIMFLINNYYKK